MNEAMEMVLAYLARRIHMRGAKIVVTLVLMAYGLTNTEIHNTFGLSMDSLRKYRRALDSDQIDSLFEIDTSNRQKSEMEKFNKEIDASFDENQPKTLREARDRIEEITGLHRSINRVRKYLLKRGLRIGPQV